MPDWGSFRQLAPVVSALPRPGPLPRSFLVKTVRHSEMRLLLSLIPKYYRHIQANPGTLLTRFYGVHRLTPIIGRQVGAGSAAFCGSCARTVVDRRVGCAAAAL